MRNIITLFIFLFLNFTSFGQSMTEYDTCHYLKQFEGEWKYVNGLDTLRIYLRFHKKTITTNKDFLIQDVLIGWHEFKKGDLIIESDYQNRFMNLPDDVSKIYSDFSVDLRFDKMKNPCELNSKILTGYIKDYLQANQHKEMFITLNDKKTKMSCKLWHEEWVGHGNGKTEMTLPEKFVLIRQ